MENNIIILAVQSYKERSQCQVQRTVSFGMV